MALFIIATTALNITVIATGPPSARADVIAYLVNVSVRPGHAFGNADAAVAYGRGICDAVTSGHTYGALIERVKADISTGDDYQASYLITQAVNELCPAAIWNLRNTAVRQVAP